MYEIKLHYGCEEHESGIFHSFRAVVPEEQVDESEIAKNLAAQLDREADDDCFHHGSMYVPLPAALIDKIKSDAVKEYLANK